MSAATEHAVSYEIHPLADLVPRMSEDEYAELREDIAANGLLSPITLHEGKVLDGRHRYRACQETGVWPTFETYDGDGPASFVLSHNLHRRNLSESQKAMLAVEFLPALEQEAADRKAAALASRRDPGSGQSQSAPDGAHRAERQRATNDAAEKTGASGRSVQKAKRVKEADPELAQRVLQGEVKVTTAEREVVARERAAQDGRKPEKPETGAVRPAAISRIAEQAAGIAMAAEALAINKSCERMTDEDRSTALDSCKAGLRALNTMAKALGR